MLSFYKRIFPYRLGNPADIGMERRRRSKEVVPLAAPATGDAVASVVDAVDALDKPLSAPSSGSAIEDVTDEERLEWYAVADEYWKEYLNDLARKAVIEKMVGKINVDKNSMSFNRSRNGSRSSSRNNNNSNSSRQQH